MTNAFSLAIRRTHFASIDRTNSYAQKHQSTPRATPPPAKPKIIGPTFTSFESNGVQRDVPVGLGSVHYMVVQGEIVAKWGPMQGERMRYKSADETLAIFKARKD